MTPPLRSAIAAVLLSFSVVNTADACKCAMNYDPVFLHAEKDSSIVLPANARGVLLHAQPYLATSMRPTILSAAPKPVDIARFTIIEKPSGKRLEPVLTRVNVDLQNHPAGGEKYYLGESAKVAGLQNMPSQDFEVAAQKLGLPDITSAVRKGMGIFRVGPKTGFELGKTYVISYEYEPEPNQLRTLSINVSVAAPVAMNRHDVFALRLDGPPRRQNLMTAANASCTRTIPAIVQRINYSLPEVYRPYASLISFYTFQKFPDGDLAHVPGVPFVHTNIRESLCSRVAPGASALGPLNDIAYAHCSNTPVPARAVKGYVGMLELEDTLHETAIVDIPFASATGPACATI